jgi:hypothetical protein
MSMSLLEKRKRPHPPLEDSKRRRKLMVEAHPLTSRKLETLKKRRKSKALHGTDLYA